MNKYKSRISPPATGIAANLAKWLMPVSIIAFTLWQGSYFPVQFLLMLAVLAAVFVLQGKQLTITKEPLLLLGISLLYAVSTLLLSENHYTGLIETLRVLIFPLALIFFYNSDAERNRKAIFVALIAVAILGLLAVAEMINIKGGVIESSGRMQSVIQYANTTALLMLLGILYSIDSYIARRKLIILVPCAIFAVSLFLTGSRTSLAVAVAACALYAFIKSGRRGKIITAACVAAAGIAIVGLGVFTDLRIFRISLYEPTLVERWITYQDAAGMLRTNWLFGIGTGGWQEQQLGFQSAPYYVKYIHNFYIQMLLDGGVLAPLLFCAALIPAVCRGIRAKSLHAIILIAIMVQAMLDFDLIFGAVVMIAMFSLSQLISGGKVIAIGKFRYAAIAPLLALCVLWCSEASSAIADAKLARNDAEASMNGYKTALSLNPLRTELYYRMAQSTDDIGLMEDFIRKALGANSLNLRSVSILARIEAAKGDYGAALVLCEYLIENGRFSAEYQALYRDVADAAASSGIISGSEHEHILESIFAIRQGVNPLYTLYIDKEY